MVVILKCIFNVFTLTLIYLIAFQNYALFSSILYIYSGWPRVSDDACSLLFLADPQIQGNTLEPPGSFTCTQPTRNDHALLIENAFIYIP